MGADQSYRVDQWFPYDRLVIQAILHVLNADLIVNYVLTGKVLIHHVKSLYDELQY